jgi:hypothetical protein
MIEISNAESLRIPLFIFTHGKIFLLTLYAKLYTNPA